jgi:transcriptional regulator with XRE-family HTH domain
MGETIETLAARQGIRADELAAMAGVTVPTLNRIITGRIASPRVATVAALACALNVKMEKLVG